MDLHFHFYPGHTGQVVSALIKFAANQLLTFRNIKNLPSSTPTSNNIIFDSYFYKYFFATVKVDPKETLLPLVDDYF
jgi:hypothetical protein